MKSQISHNIKQRKVANDVFYTPINLVNKHLDIVGNINCNEKVLDPFYGNGAYYNEIVKKYPNAIVYYTEIEMGLDFFDFNDKVDYIISNPPYSIINKVLEHSIKLSPKIISYLIGINNLTPKRIEYMNNNGYYIKNIHMTKVYDWYGMSIIVVFSNLITENIITFDRTIYHNEN